MKIGNVTGHERNGIKQTRAVNTTTTTADVRDTISECAAEVVGRESWLKSRHAI